MHKSAELLTFIMGLSLQSCSTTHLPGLQVLMPKAPAWETCSVHHHISTTAILTLNIPLPHSIFSLTFSTMHFTCFCLLHTESKLLEGGYCFPMLFIVVSLAPRIVHIAAAQ